MNKLILSSFLVVLASVAFAFPVHYNTGTYDIATSGTAAWNAFSWKWSNRDVQQFSLTFTNSASGEGTFSSVTNVQIRFSYPEAGPFFLTIANGSIVANANSLTYTLPAVLPTTNIPPPKRYYVDILAYSSDGSTRSFAKGMGETTWSLFYNTNTAVWVPISVTFSATSAVTVVETDPIHVAWLPIFTAFTNAQATSNTAFSAYDTAQTVTNSYFQGLFTAQGNTNAGFESRIAVEEGLSTAQAATNTVFRNLHTAQGNTNVGFEARIVAEEGKSTAQAATNTIFRNLHTAHVASNLVYQNFDTAQVNTNVIFEGYHTAQVNTNVIFEGYHAAQVNTNVIFAGYYTAQIASNLIYQNFITAQTASNLVFEGYNTALKATNAVFEPRIVLGETAYGWGNHASAGYLSATQTIYSTLTIGDRTKLGSNLSGLTNAIYTGSLSSVSFTGVTEMVVGRVYAVGYTKIGADGTSTLSIAGQSLARTAAGTSSNFFTYSGTDTNLILKLDGTGLAQCNASNIYVKQITNGAANVVDLNVGNSATLGGETRTTWPSTNCSVSTNDAVYLAALTNATFNQGTSNNVSVSGRVVTVTFDTNYDAAGAAAAITLAGLGGISNESLWIAASNSVVYTNQDIVWTTVVTNDDTNTLVIADATNSNPDAWGTCANIDQSTNATGWKFSGSKNWVEPGNANAYSGEMPPNNIPGYWIGGGGTATGTIYVTYATVISTNTYRLGVNTNGQQFLSVNGTNIWTMDGTSNQFTMPSYGNWAGTWQGLGTNAFYPMAGNPSNWVTDIVTNALNARLTAHTTNTANPHVVTAAQAGALSTTGGTMGGALFIGTNRIYFGTSTSAPWVEGMGTTNIQFGAGTNTAIFGSPW